MSLWRYEFRVIATVSFALADFTLTQSTAMMIGRSFSSLRWQISCNLIQLDAWLDLFTSSFTWCYVQCKRPFASFIFLFFGDHLIVTNDFFSLLLAAPVARWWIRVYCLQVAVTASQPFSMRFNTLSSLGRSEARTFTRAAVRFATFSRRFRYRISFLSGKYSSFALELSLKEVRTRLTTHRL